MEKEPLKSVKMSTGTRVYYFDVHKDSKGKNYLMVSEIPTDSNPGSKKRGKLFIHSDNLSRFMKAIDEVADFIQNDLPDD